MHVEIGDSARRHGITDDDMLHAYRNPIRVLEGQDLTVYVGADWSGRLLEVGVVTDEAADIDAIVHAMPVRRSFLR